VPDYNILIALFMGYLPKPVIILLISLFPAFLYSQARTDKACTEKTFLFDSKILNQSRRIFIALPHDHRDKSYPVMYLLSAVPGDFRPRILQPRFIVAGIESPDPKQDFLKQEDRDRFRSFLQMELIPYIDAEYNTLPARFISGHSLPGGFVMDVFISDPGMFSFYIATSPALNLIDPEKIQDIRLKNETGLYFNIGDRENYEQLETANNKFYELLSSQKADQLHLKYEILNDESHETNEFTGFCRGFGYFMSLQSVPDTLLGQDIDSIIRYTETIKDRFGFKIKVGENVVMPNILINLEKGEYDKVLKTVQYISAEMPGFMNDEAELMIEIGRELEKRGQGETALKVFKIINDKTHPFPSISPY